MRYTLIFLAVFAPASLVAQELLEVPRFPSADFFKTRFEAPRPPRVELRNPVRLSDFVVDDKLELSLRSYLELVMANNTDVEIQKLSLETPKNAITAAFGRFDPAVTASFSSQRANRQTNDVLAGAAVSSTLTQPLRFNYQQTLETGTQYAVGFTGSKSASNSSFTNFNPAITAGMSFSFTQPLLRDRGAYVNRLQIMVARSRYRQSEFQFVDQLQRILQAAENAYWAVIEARESLQVQEQGLELQDKLLKRSQRELELGAISPLEIYRPQQSYASQEVIVTQARYQLQQREDVLRRQIGADLDPQYQNMPILLTETALPPADDTPLDKEQHVEAAYQNRPDLKSQLQSLDIDDLNYRQARNRLLPSFNLTGSYESSGRGGVFYQRRNVFAGDGTTSSVVSVIPGGLGDALSQLWGFNFPTYSFGLNLQLPLRDRAGSADLANALVSKKINALRVRNTQQQIRQEVLNAVTQVESSRAGVKLAQVALDFSQKNAEAEQRRYDLGVTTIFFLLDAQNALTRAQADLVTQSVRYRRSQLDLLRVTGQLLESRGVQVQ